MTLSYTRIFLSILTNPELHIYFFLHFAANMRFCCRLLLYSNFEFFPQTFLIFVLIIGLLHLQYNHDEPLKSCVGSPSVILIAKP
jgi:hypothetical protein